MSTSSHYRSASATERPRPQSYHNSLPSRATTTRSRDHDHSRPHIGENGSPILSDDFESQKSAKANDIYEKRKSYAADINEKRIQRNTHYLIENTTKKTTTTRHKDADVNGRTRNKASSPENPVRPHRRSQPDVHVKPWKPEAKLVACSSAPLSVRITPPAVKRDAPAVLSSSNLADMDTMQQESALLEDLLYVFMGFEGDFISFVDGYTPSEEKQRLYGPEWQINPGLDPSLRDLVEGMLTTASRYIALEAFVEVQSREEYGKVNHALCAAIRRLLSEYLKLVAQLEAKVVAEHTFTLHRMHLETIPMAQSVAQLYAVAQELLKKNDLLDVEVEQSMDDFDADNIIERLKEGGDLLPGSMTKKKCVGGNVLALLTQRLSVHSGDPAAKKVLQLLLQESSRPYTNMLNEWLHHGTIIDPHAEFLIGERTSIKRERLDEDYTDEYWEKRYYVREQCIPPQLQYVKDKILLAGKYLNVVKECGGLDVASKVLPSAPKTFDDPGFLDNINQAYNSANSELLRLLLAKNSLRGRLRSIKHYFFLDRAEFFAYFLELSANELRKPQRSVNVSKMQSLLDLVLHQPGSIALSDPYKEDVSVKMNDLGLVPWLMKIVNVQGLDADDPEGIAEQYRMHATTATSGSDIKDISGYEALELDYAVPFPLSLIISRKTITRYQLIQRYTVSLRHLETILVEAWSDHNKAMSWTHKSTSQRIETWKRRAWILRARMLVFVQQMLFYATAEVLEPQWQKFMSKVDTLESPLDDLSRPSTSRDIDTDSQSTSTNPQSSASNTHNANPFPPKPTQTVDSLMQTHLDMLDSSMKDLGLTQSKLLKIHARLLTGCTMFASYTTNLTRSLYSADGDFAFLHTPAALQTPAQRREAAKTKQNFSQYGGGSGSGEKEREIPAPDPARLDRIEQTLAEHERYFNRHLRVLIDTLNYFAATETGSLLALCARLSVLEHGGRRKEGMVE